jgi:hypothetical protein
MLLSPNMKLGSAFDISPPPAIGGVILFARIRSRV